MNDTLPYRLTKNQKKDIAQNLIDILKKKVRISPETKRFIKKWITTDRSDKRKAFYDVWEIVLNNYMPTTRPILFRVCDRISKDGKIASFTGSFESAKRFSESKGSMIICNTKETLSYDKSISHLGGYQYTFYPLVTVLKKIEICEKYIGEDEYIMRVHLDHMSTFRWT